MAINPTYGQFSAQAASNQQQPQLIPDKQKQPQGTGYTNLQSILAANQGNKLGNAVVGGVQKVGQQAQTGLQNAQQTFGQGIQNAQNDLSNRQSMVQNTFGNYDQPTTGSTFQGFAPGAAEGFSDLRNSQYNGPKGLNNSQGLQQGAKQAAQMGQMGQSAGGRQQLLSTVVGTPGYTQAQQAEDALFLGQSQPQLRQAGLQNQRLVGQTQQAINSAQNTGNAQANALQQLQQQAAQGIQQRQGTLTGAINTQQQGLQKQADTRQNQVSQFNTLLQQDPNKAIAYGTQQGLIDPTQGNLVNQIQGINQLGFKNITNLQNMGMGGLNVFQADPTQNKNISLTPANQLQQLFNFGNVDSSTAAATTADQAARENALAQLGGQKAVYTSAQQNAPITQTNADVQKGLLQADITNLQNQYINPQQAKLDVITRNLDPAAKQQFYDRMQNEINRGGVLESNAPDYAQLQNYNTQLAALQKLLQSTNS